MARAGRKPTPTHRQAIPVGIERRHLDMVDEIIKEDLREEFRVSRRAVTERAEAGGKTYRLERRVHIPNERRRLLGEMVEFYRKHRAASAIKVFAPCESTDADERREVNEWVADMGGEANRDGARRVSGGPGQKRAAPDGAARPRGAHAPAACGAGGGVGRRGR